MTYTPTPATPAMFAAANTEFATMAMQHKPQKNTEALHCGTFYLWDDVEFEYTVSFGVLESVDSSYIPMSVFNSEAVDFIKESAMQAFNDDDTRWNYLDGEDYISISQSPKRGSGNRGATIDYHITLDMGKELAMVERNEFGKAARRYFIALERQIKTVRPTLALSTVDDRKPLKDAVNRLVKKHDLDYSSVWTKIHERFAVDNVEQLPVSRIEHAVGYVHMLDVEYHRVTPTIVSVPHAGRFFISVDKYNSNQVSIKDLDGHSIVNANIVRKLQADLKSLTQACFDMAQRLRLVDGEASLTVIEQPLKISLSTI